MMQRTLILIYGVLSYALFFGVFSYAILFIGNLWVSPSLDTVGSGGLGQALLIDLGLLGAFAIQHSVMARAGFKRVLTRIVPAAMERSTYVLASTLLLGAIVFFWQPLGGVVWQVESAPLVIALYGLFALGWALLFAASFQLNHWDLFGLRQVWLNFRGLPYTPIQFRTPWLYRYVRHPLYAGLLIGLWAAPTMTIAHLVFAAMCTGYILVGSRLEERDLKQALPEYAAYQRNVPMLMPRLRGAAGQWGEAMSD
ncbi:MAG: isoprenylcysteine carboxylmethyltransferase family protein [Halioglobus sp.]|nr:isoprenylcysteine carboxylmethyltransferase family protein [Halioglobus sp.]